MQLWSIQNIIKRRRERSTTQEEPPQLIDKCKRIVHDCNAGCRQAVDDDEDCLSDARS
jgi:hypothetical protein